VVGVFFAHISNFAKVQLDDINHCGLALLQYAATLPGNEYKQFENKNGRWVCDPNFVNFQVHYKRKNNIPISLRGNPAEFEKHDELPMKPGMAGYSECSFESRSQLFAAVSYIRRAWQIYKKGRSRRQTRPVTSGE